MHATTIIARNYLAYARVWAESFARHHRHASTSVLVLDDPDGDVGRGETFEVLRVEEIGIPRRELHRMATIYTVLELSTAVKPWLLRTLLDRGHDAVLYFDPDIAVYQPLDDLFALAEAHGVVLTPHITEPMPDDDLRIDERTIRLSGTFNLGFVGVSRKAGSFLDWWADHLARGCRVAFEEGQFVDQRYVDLIPALFEHQVVRDPTLNVAYWNVHQRALARNGMTYTVGERRLRFYHFSGFDPARPWLLSKHQSDRPRVLLSEHPALARLCEEYADAIHAHGYDEFAPLEYGLDRLPNGLRLDVPMRAAYRAALERSENDDDAPEPPSPFEPGECDRFVAWLKETPPGFRMPRYLRSFYDRRPELWSHFPDVEGVHARPFIEWAATHGWRLAKLEPTLLLTPTEFDEREARKAAPPPTTQGANLLGYLTAELGIGEAARQLAQSLELVGVPHASIVFDRTSSRLGHAFHDDGLSGAKYDTNLICVNADALQAFAHDVGPSFFAGRRNVGIWWWEVTSFPDSWRASFDLVDEVWVGSRFVQEALAEVATKPIWAYPVPLAFPDPPERSRADLGLPEGFLFLFSFDFFSVAKRKNPAGVIEAFTRAFADGEGPQLVVKSINGGCHRVELEELRVRAAGRSDVTIIDGYLEPADKDALMAACDAYVSLHRSEGFGLTLAEAMWNGKPTIATAYGGNTDFMTSENAYLVPYELVGIGPGAGPYPAEGTWAEPDIEEAARLLRQIVERPGEAASRAERGRRELRDRHAPERTGTMVRERLELLTASPPRRDQDTVAAPAGPSALERAATSIEHGPATSWDSPSRFGALGRGGRRLLRRVMRPYEHRQRELDESLVEALLEVNHRTAHLEEVLRSTAVSSEDRARALQADLRATRELLASVQVEEHARLQHAIAGLERRMRRLSATTSGAHERLSAAQAALERQLTEVNQQVGRLGQHADAAEEIKSRLTELDQSLHPRPYTSDPSLLHVVDETGTPAIGTRSGPWDRRHGVYSTFEDVFRGPEELIRERQRFYLPLLDGHAPVLDVGCGRGEFLDLLAGAGVAGRGVDIDAGMVSRARAKGHSVERAEAIEYLEALSRESLGAIFSAQVIEHLSGNEIVDLLELAHEKLVPGGVLIAETLNPHALHAFKTFWIDPTHRTPIFPEVAAALCAIVGFETTQIVFPNGSGDLEHDRRTQGEYAAVATKARGRGPA